MALDIFDALPQKCKPRRLASGQREWTPLSAVAVSRPLRLEDDSPEQQQQLKVVSLATGTKSLPVSALSKCKGLVLHDCHAEILAFRGLNHWLLCEIERILQNEGFISEWIETVASNGTGEISPPFRLCRGVEIALFSTEAPCGDASMELLMASAQASGADVRPWPTSSSASHDASSENSSALPPGRGYFSNLGVLRRKPARADAEVSMSRSCTDKIMLRQFASLLQFPVDLFVQPSKEAFLSRLVLYEDQYNEFGYKRAFSADGRLRDVVAEVQREDEGNVVFFEVERLTPEFRRFEFEKSMSLETVAARSRVTNISTIWIADGNGLGGQDTVEVLVNGVKQGYKQFDQKVGKGSVLCRFKIVQKALGIAEALRGKGMVPESTGETGKVMYSELKATPSRSRKKIVKDFVLDRLGGWPKKQFEDDFQVSSDMLRNTDCRGRKPLSQF
ncbi:hypothetical protein LTS08_000631 [Lithohypha guttulata]|uniref:uncharacterized protein n=1 Tax=Lithohypha guttulata TaxID=1690604 RepID=UPI002DE06842|nr:hypothetical protein LTR51_006992 [Lithohypha guttulata]KAK5106512.1 hypothetical protein LTS08_000631 [Lithohypha guttulata]